MQVQQFYDYTDMLKANLQSAITIGGKLQFKDDKQYQEFLDAGLIIGSLLVNSESANVYNTSDNTIWDAVEAKVTLWGGDPANDMNLRHLALVEILDGLSAPDDILVQIEKVRVVAKFDVVDETKIQFGDTVYVEADPYSSTKVKAFWGDYDIYRICVKPDGDDTKSGLDWENAVATIQGAMSKIPDNLGGTSAHILFYPGDYIITERYEISKNNGHIVFSWMGSWVGSSDIVNAEWYRVGKEQSYFTSDEPVNFIMSEDIVGYWGFSIDSTEKNLKFSIENRNPDNGKKYWDKIRFVGNVSGGIERVVHLKGVACQFNDAFTIDLKGSKIAVCFSSNTSGFMRAYKIIGGTNANSTAFVYEGVNVTMGIYSYAMTYETGYAPEQNYGHLEKIVWMLEKIETASENETKFLKNSHYIDNSAIANAKPKLKIGPTAGGIYSYDTDQMDLQDSSTKARTINVYTNGSLVGTINYINSKIKTNGDSTIYKVSTTVPADADLSNQDVVFYMDEATDTLKVKYKDSGGVVQTGEIAVLT